MSTATWLGSHRNLQPSLCLAGALWIGWAHAGDVKLTRADYGAATAVLEGNLQGLVRNESVIPHWIGNSGPVLVPA